MSYDLHAPICIMCYFYHSGPAFFWCFVMFFGLGFEQHIGSICIHSLYRLQSFLVA